MKKLFIILSLAIFAANVSYAQKLKIDETVFTTAEVKPEFQGGEKGMYAYIGKNLKYPKQAVKANVIGKVFAKMIIEKDGSIKNVEILKGIGYGCDEEVQRVLKSMPKWTAAMDNGKAVRFIYTLPIMFDFDKKNSK